MAEHIYSKINPEKLLHIIFLKEDLENVDGRKDIINPNNFLQLSALNMEKGKTFKPHKHIWTEVDYDKRIAQESWIVIQGQVLVYYYDTDGSFLFTRVIESGDCSITLEGGHTYEIMKDNTLVFETKTGPYKSREFDKVEI